MAGTILTNSVHSGTILSHMARVRSFTFEYFAATKDTRLFLDEADSSVRENFIDRHGRLIAVFAGAFDKSFVDKILRKFINPLCCFEVSEAVGDGAFRVSF